MESAPVYTANYPVRQSLAESDRSEDIDDGREYPHRHHPRVDFASLPPPLNAARESSRHRWRFHLSSFLPFISSETARKLPMTASDGWAYRRVRPSGSGPDGSDLDLELSGSGSLSSGSRSAATSFQNEIRTMLLSTWLNSLVVFIPIGFATYYFRVNPIWIFITNTVAIVPLSTLLTEATERVANESGDLVGALLNISLGNLVELIIFVALINNHIAIVQASILGSILVNLLLILGSALLTSHARGFKMSQEPHGTQLLGCLLFVSVFAFLMPTTFDYTFRNVKESHSITLKMTRFSAFVVLFLYILYFVHELRTPVSPPEHEMEERGHEPDDASHHSHGARSVRFADDERNAYQPNFLYTINSPIEMNHMVPKEESIGEPTSSDTVSRSRANSGSGPHPPSAYQHVRSRRGSRSMSLSSLRGYPSQDPAYMSGERPTSRQSAQSAFSTFQVMLDNRRDLEYTAHGQMAPHKESGSIAAPTVVLIISSALMSMCAEFLVSTIDEVTHQGHLSESMIGLIILPIVGNIAEYVTVVAVAAKDKMDLAVAVSIGSSIQIALCVTPLTVLAGWILDRDLALTFSPFEMMTLFGSVLLVNLLILTGGSSASSAIGLKGALMCGCYAIISLGAYLAPSLPEH